MAHGERHGAEVPVRRVLRAGGCGVKRCTQDGRFAAIDLSMINVFTKDAGYA